MPSGVATPDDRQWADAMVAARKDAADALAAARKEIDALGMRPFLLGYNVTPTVSIRLGADSGPVVSVTYEVWRIDQRPQRHDGHSVSSIAEVEAHLDHLRTLPVYRLDLLGPEIREEQDGTGPFTVITDAASDDEFYVRVINLEAFTTLDIHAEEPPTANWHRANSG